MMVRMYRENNASTTCGMMEIEDSVNIETYKEYKADEGDNRCLWKFMSKRVEKGTSFLKFRVYGDYGNTDGFMFIDKIDFVISDTPKDGIKV